MRKLLLMVAVAVLGGAAGGTAAVAPAAAGGWAVATIDPFTVPSPGETVEIGFVVRRHGVTPEDFPGSSMEVTAPDGRSQRFAAEPDGVTGHHRADVVFPAAGEFTWSVDLGGLMEQDLGTIEIGAQPAGVAPGGHRLPLVVRLGLPALAGALAVLAIIDLLGARRRPAPA